MTPVSWNSFDLLPGLTVDRPYANGTSKIGTVLSVPTRDADTEVVTAVLLVLEDSGRPGVPADPRGDHMEGVVQEVWRMSYGEDLLVIGANIDLTADRMADDAWTYRNEQVVVPPVPVDA